MSKIEFVRFRSWINGKYPMVDIKYRSGRLVSVGEDGIPKTVKAFLKTAKTKCSFDYFWGFEILYQ